MTNRQRTALLMLFWLGPYLLLGLTGYFAIHAYRNEVDTRSAHEHQEQVNACHQRAEDRDALRQTIVLATSGGSGVDLTTVEGFDRLDLFQQDYLRNLTARLTTSSPEQRKRFQDNLLAELPQITCQE